MNDDRIDADPLEHIDADITRKLPGHLSQEGRQERGVALVAMNDRFVMIGGKVHLERLFADETLPSYRQLGERAHQLRLPGAFAAFGVNEEGHDLLPVRSSGLVRLSS